MFKIPKFKVYYKDTRETHIKKSKVWITEASSTIGASNLFFSSINNRSPCKRLDDCLNMVVTCVRKVK